MSEKKETPKCKCYDDESCAIDCKHHWVKCDLCEEELDYADFDDMEINGYVVLSASLSCSDDELWDRVLIICPKCFKKIKELKKKK